MKYAKEGNGTVKKYNLLPVKYENILNFRKANLSTIQSKGFYEVVEPSIMIYQRLLPLEVLDFANDIYTHRIYDFTQAEKDEYDQRQLDNDSAAQKNNDYRADGQREHKRIWDKIMRLYDNGQLTENQFDTISDLLFDAVLPMELGMWKIAQSRVDALPVGSGILEQIRVSVKEIIDGYVINNY